MRLRFMFARRRILNALDIHPVQPKWPPTREAVMNKQFNAEDVEVAEELFTELLFMAMTCNPRLRGPLTDLAEGVAAIISDDAVERSKDYAIYRKNQLG